MLVVTSQQALVEGSAEPTQEAEHPLVAETPVEHLGDKEGQALKLRRSS